MNFNEKLENILKQKLKFCDTNNELLKQKVKSYALEFDEDLIGTLLDDADTREHFFKKISDATIFDYRKFIDFIDDKNFLLDSYTKFSNKVGLTVSNKHIKQIDNVVLSFPFKDCVLEGGQSKEDENRKEIFFNETLAKDEINRLLGKKVITNATKYYYENNKVKETQDVEFTRDKEINKKRGLSEDTITDNLIIKGNNLLALHTLKSNFASKVKLIYIDPPYNTGNDSFGYNDSFNHSTWLTFMKNRLEIARELLADDGVIFISIDDDESHYLKVILDEIFKRKNFITNIVWKKKHTRSNDAKFFSDNHDHILVFSKNKEAFKINKLNRTPEQTKNYKNLDNDSRGVWMSQPIQVKTPTDAYIYEIITPIGKSFYPPKGRSWQFSKDKYNKMVADNRIWFGSDGKNVPRIKKFLTEVSEGIIPTSIWDRDEVGDNQEAKNEMKKLFPDFPFGTPKPERLLERIIHISTKENDLILDFFSGSGTTCAVAHKLNRQYIGIEQMDYIHDLPEVRLIKVINGEQGGISEVVNWQGGGEFIYLELDKYNQKFIDDLSEATEENILDIYDEICKKGFLNYDIELKKIKENFEEFKAFSLEQKKEFLLSMLNKNQLYKNLSEIDDKDLEVSDKIKELNKNFYNIKEEN